MAMGIATLLEGVVLTEHQWKIKLFNCWETIVGDLKKHVRIESLSQGVLLLGVSHPVWAQELSFLSEMLKNKINGVLEGPYISSVRFKTVMLKPPHQGSMKNAHNDFVHKQNVQNITLSVQESLCLKKIKDDELKQALLDYYQRSKERKGS